MLFEIKPNSHAHLILSLNQEVVDMFENVFISKKVLNIFILLKTQHALFI